MRTLLVFVLIVLFGACTTDSEILESSNDEINVQYELFDSLNFGAPKKTLVQFTKNESIDSTSITIYFKRKKKDWSTVDSFSKETSQTLIPEIEFEDYNFDGYTDMSFISDLGMNGSNEMRTIILYKPEGKGIKVLEESIRYPNIRLNKKKNFLVSTIFSGSTQNIFFRIDNDTIRKLASLNLDKELTLSVYDKGQKTREKTISNVTVNEYSRFIDYNPIEIEE